MKIESYELNGVRVDIPQAESYCDCYKLIKSDLYRLIGRDVSYIDVIRHLLKPFSNTVLFWFRLASYKGAFSLLFRYKYRQVSRKYCVQIPYGTKVGRGFYIGHGICIVVNGNAVIGNNVNISQFVNIGTNDGKAALLGDKVYVGPQTAIVGHISIGACSTIGAGSVVNKDFGENSTAAGVPAKILNGDFSIPARFICNPCRDVDSID